MNRPPKTKLIVALGGALLAATAFTSHAAGLGRLAVNSALGQPLSAEIELVSLLPGEFEAIAARAASPEAYADAKIEYSPLLRSLKFSAERRADGKPVLKISSSAPINEPFLDVLVEMNWPSGKLVREYPILLDPPGFSQTRVTPPAVSAAPPARVVPQSVPVASVPSVAPAIRREISGDTYGPVKEGDTLHAIATSLKPGDVSLEQMLVAMYQQNRQAFVGNMNRLKTGEILRVPNAVEVSQVAPATALREIQVQVADWKKYRDSIAGAVVATPAKPGMGNAGAGKISVAKPDAPANAGQSSDKLKIAKSDTTGRAGATGAGAKGADQNNALREELVAKENQVKEANSRVAALEKQIADMRKLMALQGVTPPVAAKSADTKVAAKPDEKAKTPEAAKAPEAAKPAVPPLDTKVAQAAPTKAVEPPKATDAAKTDAAKTVAAKTEPAKTEPAKSDAAKLNAPKIDAAKTDVANADAAKAPAKTDVAKAETKPTEVAKSAAPATTAKGPAKPAPEPDFLEENMGTLLGSGAAVVGLGGLALWMRSRKSSTKKGPSSGMANTSSVTPSDLKPNTVTGNRAGGLVDTGNSSFLTDFDKTGPGMIDTDEVDPVAEAEVYIAYGRDAQAEEILKEAMTRDKNRHEIAMKLLEIYHARKSPQAFGPVARELHDSIGTNHPMWAKVASMGASIDPANTLYGATGANLDSTMKFPAASAALVSGAAGLAGATAMTATHAAATAPSPDLDFDLGFDDPPSGAPSAIDITSAAPAAPAVMDFDLDLNSPAPSVAPAVAAKVAAAPAAESALDFDLAFDVPAASTPTASVASAAPAAPTFDFDLSALSLDTPATAPVVEQHAFVDTVTTNAAAFDKTTAVHGTNANLDAAKPAADGGAASSAAATKLELAKAYIEIGDADGAKDILHEVAREGSAAQRNEAKKILAGI